MKKSRKRFFKLAALAALALFVFTACDDDDDDYKPESVVTTAFKAKYPDAKKVSWSDQGSYKKASFLLYNHDVEAWFDAGGTWVMTETDINYEELPVAVRNAYQASPYYQLWGIDDIEMLERLDMATVYTLVVQQNENTYRTLFYDANGILVKEYEGDDVPGTPVVLSGTVKNFLAQRYPNAAIVNAHQVDNGGLDVEIMDNSRVKEVQFNKEQNWIMTKWQVAEPEVPRAVMNVLGGSAYAGYTVDSIHYYVYPSGTEYYHFVLKKTGSNDLSVNIDPDGNLVI